MNCDQSPSPCARYQAFIAQKLETYNQYGIKELWGKKFRACFHGWVILSNPDSVLWSLWNPLTSKLIRLPPLIVSIEKQFYECCLSSPPDEQGSVFLLTTPTNHTIIFCRLDCKKKRLKWIKMSYVKQIRSISGKDCFLIGLTCCNGKIYALTNNMDYKFIIQVDIMVKGKEVVIDLLPGVKFPRSPTFSFHTIGIFLKASCKDLFFIEVYFEDIKTIVNVHLFKLDTTSMTWEEMKDLKDAVLCLQISIDNASSVFYKDVVASEMGGYVYILDFMDKIISFRVKDRTMSLPSKPFVGRESQMLVWTMLECRLEVDLLDSKQQKDEEKDNEIVVRSLNADKNEVLSTSESYVLNIPFHILEMIMKLCVGIEYMNFRATCKRCKLAAPSIPWSSKEELGRLEMYSLVCPWLIVMENDRAKITFIDPLCGDRYYIKIPEELNAGCEIFCSRYGWLLMYGVNGYMAFFNPFTSEIRKLPIARFFQSLCFSAPPTSPDCVVVGFRKPDSDVYVHLVSQESSWRRYRLNIGSNDPHSFRLPTFYGRDMYVFCNKKRIEAFKDMGEEDISRVVVVDKAHRTRFGNPAWYFLTNCDQHVLFIQVHMSGELVEVFKVNGSTNKLERINDLGKHTIYISDTSCICLEAKSPEMENKIYFPRILHNDDTKIVFYSLETCRYHTFDNKNIHERFSANILESIHYCYPCTWIQPRWS